MSIRPMGLSPSSAAGAYVSGSTKTVDLSAGGVALSITDVHAYLVDLTAATGTVVVTFPVGPYTTRVRNSTDYTQTLQKTGSTKSVSLNPGAELGVTV